MVERRALGRLVIAVAIGGCFADSPSGDAGPGTSASTGPSDCPIGALSCPCTSGGGCDTGLECHAPSGLCFDATCDPGSETCTCLDGGCVNGLECRDELCQPPLPSGTDTSAGETSAGDTTMAVDGSTTGTLDTTTVAPITTTTMSESTEGPEPTCEECWATMGMGMCATEWAACDTDPMGQTGCPDAQDCGPAPICCPMPSERTSTNLFNDLLECVAPVCAAPCGEILQCG